MLTAFLLNKNKKIQAAEAQKQQGPFICPACKKQLTLRKGSIRIHHFAHKHESNCYYKGESQVHLRTKLDIYEYIQQQYGAHIQQLELEYFLPGLRPDVYVEGKKKKIAIEVQVSPLSPKELFDRTAQYQQLGIYVLWVLPFDQKRMLKEWTEGAAPQFKPFRLKWHEQLIAFMYFRTLTFWDLSHRFSKAFLLAQMEDTWTSGGEYYSIDWSTTLQFEPKKQKNKKRPAKVRFDVTLADLQPIIAPAFQMRGLSLELPKRNILSYYWGEKG